MSFHPTESKIEGRVRQFAYIGPVNGMSILNKDRTEQRKFRANADNILGLLLGNANQFGDGKEAAE